MIRWKITALALSILSLSSAQKALPSAGLSLSPGVLKCAREKAGLDFDSKRQMLLSTTPPSLPDSRGVLPVMTQLKKSFDRYGARVLVVLPPSREMFYYAPSVARKGEQGRQTYAANYKILANTLRQAGFDVVELLTPFQKEIERSPNKLLYFNEDFHWNFNGSDVASREIYSFMSKDRPALLKSLGRSSFDIITKNGERDAGLLQKQLSRACPAYLPRRTTQKDVTIMDRKFDLFEEALVTTLLVGTSFSTGSNMAFGQLLSAKLSTPIANEAVSGGNLYGGFFQAFSKEDYAHSQVKLIIWELPAFYWGSGDFANLKDRTFLRQILPAIERGGSKLAQHSLTIKGGKISPLKLKLQSKGPMYLKMTFDGGGTRRVDLSLKYGQAGETLTLERPTGNSTNIYYLSLPASARALSSVSLGGLPQDVTRVKLEVMGL